MTNLQNALGRVVRAGDPVSKTNLKVKAAVGEIVKALEAEAYTGMNLDTYLTWKVQGGKITDGILYPTVSTRLALSFAKTITTSRFLELFSADIEANTGVRSEIVDKMIDMTNAIMKRSWAEYLEGKSD